MAETEQMVAVRWAFREDHFVLRFHAHVEMLTEGLRTSDLRHAGSGCELLEEYPERPEGHTKLILGSSQDGRPIHLVLNVERFEQDPAEPLAVVTVYEPESPEWLDERTRRRR